MDFRTTALYIVTVSYRSLVFEDAIEALSLQHAASTGVSRYCGFDMDPSTWKRRSNRARNPSRFLSLRSQCRSVHVVAEALSY